MPIVLLRATEDSQVLFKCLVGSFACSIRLGVVGCTNVLLNVQEAAEIGCEFRSEADISVRYDFARNAIMRGYMGGIKRGHSF